MREKKSIPNHRSATTKAVISGVSANTHKVGRQRYSMLKSDYYLRRFLRQSAGYLAILEENAGS